MLKGIRCAVCQGEDCTNPWCEKVIDIYCEEARAKGASKETNMQQIYGPSSMGSGNPFPYQLSDLLYWVVKRKDGTMAKFVLERGETKISPTQKMIAAVQESVAQKYPSQSLSAWCDHTPKPSKPLWVSEDQRVALFVGDYQGARSAVDDFDFCIDGGDVIPLSFRKQKLMEGDEELIAKLTPHLTETYSQTRILKIDWFDRQAPKVMPEFWTTLSGAVYGDVMTCCHGGHGRSGTAFVCLLLNFAKDYDALDAIVHLRAVHCPRAIESKVQHNYINDVAKFLGREPNIVDLDTVHNYKERFMASKKPTAVRTRAMLGWEEGK